MKKLIIFAGPFVLSAVISFNAKASASAPSVLKNVTTKSEFIDKACAIYQGLDKNSDGLLEPDEAKKLPPWLRQAKPTSQGVISIVSVVNAATSKFTDFAKTNSLMLTEKEFNSLQESK